MTVLTVDGCPHCAAAKQAFPQARFVPGESVDGYVEMSFHDVDFKLAEFPVLIAESPEEAAKAFEFAAAEDGTVVEGWT